MGALTFEEVGYGKNVREVFADLVDEAVFMDGHDPYNGTISTTGLGSEINLERDAKLKKAWKKQDWGILDTYDLILYSEKRKSNYIKELQHYQAYTPTWEPSRDKIARQKGARMEKRFYVMTDSEFRNGKYPFISYQSLTEAKKAAKEKVFSAKEDIAITQLRITPTSKRHVKLGKFELKSDGKQYKSERKSKTKVYLPTYKFTFFVFAAS